MNTNSQQQQQQRNMGGYHHNNTQQIAQNGPAQIINSQQYIIKSGHYTLQGKPINEDLNSYLQATGQQQHQHQHQQYVIQSPPQKPIQSDSDQFAMPLQMDRNINNNAVGSGSQRKQNDFPRQMNNFGQSNSKDWAVTSIYSGMKLLENRYIDLANFYKELMLKEQDFTKKLLKKGAFDKSIVQQFDRQQVLKQQETAIKENAIIKTLIQVKDELESKIQDLKEIPTHQMDTNLQNQVDHHQTNEQKPVYSEETHEFLQQTLRELLMELDKSQVSSLHMLSTKQYDMFDLATKNKLPSALRNDYLGHWYDAKTSVSQSFADLKTALTLRQQMAQVQFKLQQNGAPVLSINKPDHLNSISSPLFSPMASFDKSKDAQRQLNTMMGEFSRYKQVVEKQAQKLKTIMLALKVKDKTLKDEKLKAKDMLTQLARSIDNQNTINEGRLRIQRSVSPVGTQDTLNRVASPFEKRLSNYQISSLQRSTPQQLRTNSRGQRLSREGQDAKNQNSASQLKRSTAKKGNGFYADHNQSSTNEKQVQLNGNNEYDLKVIRTKLSQFQAAHENASIASRQKNRYEGELLKQLDLHLSEQLMYIGQGVSIMDPQKLTDSCNALEELRDLVNQERDIFTSQGGGLGSPLNEAESYNNQNCSLQAANKQNSSQFGSQEPPQQVQHQQQQQQVKAQAFGFQAQQKIDEEEENQQDESQSSQQSMTQVNKVRQQRVQELQESNDQLFSELRKANEKYLDVRVENNKLKDQIQSLKVSVDQLKTDKNTAQSRQRALSSSGGGAYTASRKKADNTSQVPSSADAELRKSLDIMKTETLQVCTMVKTFMTAMRALQKAVSRKEPDMTQQKRSFDQAKRDLEETVESTLTKLANQSASYDNSSAAEVSKAASSTAKLKSVSTMRGQMSTSGLNQSRDGGRMVSSASMRPTSMNAPSFTKRSGQGSRHTREDQENLNLLTKQVRSLQLEKDKMRELIEELKQTSQLDSGEKELLQGKVNSKTAQVHKFASQCQMNASKIYMLESMLTDYKLAINELGSNDSVTRALTNTGSESIVHQQTSLEAKETELKSKLDEEAAKIFVNLKIDPQFVALRDELTSQVKHKEKLLDQQFSQLTFRVAEKEEDLQRLKLLFVDKLRELETSFVEISHEVVETDKVTQDVTAKRKQELQNLLEAQPMNGQNNLDRSMEAILSNYDNDETSRQMEELIQANHELMEQNEQLKEQLTEALGQAQDSHNDPSGSGKKQTVSDSLHAEMVIELNEQIDEARQEVDKFKMQIKLATASEAMSKKEIQGLKYDNKRMTMDLKDSKERFEKVKMDYQQQFATLKSTTVAMKQQLQKEYDARTTNETKYMAASKQLKIARQENQEQQAEMLMLMKRMEDMHSEQAYLKELRGDDSEATDDEEDEKDEVEETKKNQEEVKAEKEEASEDSESPTKEKKTKAYKREQEDLMEREARIAEDSQDAARYYHHLVTVTKQEFKSMKSQHAKISNADNQQLNLNSKLEDLENEKKELNAQIEKKAKGTKLVICLQNYVRKLLQEKLEASAVQLEALGSKNKQTQEEAEQYRSKASQLESDIQDTIKGHDEQMSELENNISQVRQQLVDAESQKQASREEARLAKEQEQKIAKELEEAKSPEKKVTSKLSSSPDGEDLRTQITQELEEKYKQQQQEMIQTYKRAQRDSTEKHQAALLTLEQQLSQGSNKGGNASLASDQVAAVRLQLLSEHEVMVQTLEKENKERLHKAQKTTRLMICLQNRVREMVAAKLDSAVSNLGKKDNECQSLKEDLNDVTQAHNAKLITMRESFDQEKQSETAKIIQDYEAQMKQFESKMRQESEDKTTERDSQEISALREQLDKASSAHDTQANQTKRLTKLMICLQEFVRKMLQSRLEERESELQLEIISVKESVTDYCDRLKTKEEEFEKLKEEKELDSLDSTQKLGQIDAADAQIQSLKSVQEALEREKDDLLIQNEAMEEELNQVKTELLETKGTSEVKDMRIEELEERLGDMHQQTMGLNRTSELGSSGKIVHQGDDLRSLEMNSDGMIEGAIDSFRTAGNNSDKVGGDHQNLQLEQTIEMLTAENADLREQVEKLRQDLDANVVSAGGNRNSWDGSMGRGSWGSDQNISKNREVEEHLKHVRQIMTQFLSRLPETTKENEDILPVLFSMLNFAQEEIDGVVEARAQLNLAKKGGGGMFGGLTKKKK